MISLLHKHRVFVLGLSMGLLFGAGVLAGGWLMRGKSNGDHALLHDALLHATATHGSGEFAVATGRVSEDAEGVFFLDFLTGELTCYVLYPRGPQPKMGGKFTAQVANDLGAERGKAPSYVMVTGEVQFSRGGGATRPANSVVYVVDANTGRYAAYYLLWNRGFESSGRDQAGQLKVLTSGSIRNQSLTP